jgi:putative translation initiation factor eIF-6
MYIDRLKIRDSPYIGVFCMITEDVALVPKDIKKKELEKIKKFDAEIIKANVADSILLGVLMAGTGTRFIVPELLSREEEELFSSKGLEVLQLGNKAYGNLISMNSNGGIVSTAIEKKDFGKIKRFFGTKLLHKKLSCTELTGSSLVVTDSGFIVNPGISSSEFSLLKKLFRVNGAATTANYGDSFVGNGVLANSKAAFVGSYTTGTELIRIDEGLRGG